MVTVRSDWEPRRPPPLRPAVDGPVGAVVFRDLRRGKGVVHEEVAREVDDCSADLLIQGELGEVLSLRDSFYEEGERILRKVKCPVMVVRGRDRIERMFDDL